MENFEVIKAAYSISDELQQKIKKQLQFKLETTGAKKIETNFSDEIKDS